jgi:hypothetical protein
MRVTKHVVGTHLYVTNIVVFLTDTLCILVYLTGKDLEGSGHGQNRHNRTFTWWNWGKPTTTRVSTVSVPANIRTGVLLHVNLDRHQFTNFHGNAYNNMFSILDMYNFIQFKLSTYRLHGSG